VQIKPHFRIVLAISVMLLATTAANGAVAFDARFISNGILAEIRLGSTLPQNADGSYTANGFSDGYITYNGTTEEIFDFSSYNNGDNKFFYRPGNSFYPDGGDLTLGGMSFVTQSGTYYNFYSRGLQPDGFGFVRLSLHVTHSNLPGLGAGKNDLYDASFKLTPVPLPSVPEPATWAMMIAGFGLAGTALRRRDLQIEKPALVDAAA
jgi:hypothetical protein